MTRSQTLTILILAALLAAGDALAQGQRERTSENHDGLKRMLERMPEADTDGDGILTLEEGQAAREKIQSQRAAVEAERDRTRTRQAGKPAPTKADVPYGDNPRQVLDFWKAETDEPAPLFVYIHGGGFRAGDKASFPAALLQGCLDAGISCAAIHYRLSDEAPYPAQMHDSARAIQFLRSKAKAWNLDPTRVACGGGSAGSGISQWLAFHDDMADPKSDDPVARQSTRLTCAIPMNMQSTYDPREIKKLIPGDAYKHPALPAFFGCPDDWDWDDCEIDAELDALIRDASPIHHLTADDPPIYLIHYERSNTVGNIHHSNFGKHMKAAMDKLGVECVRHMDSDFESMDAVHADMVAFLKRQFKME